MLEGGSDAKSDGEAYRWQTVKLDTGKKVKSRSSEGRAFEGRRSEPKSEQRRRP